MTSQILQKTFDTLVLSSVPITINKFYVRDMTGQLTLHKIGQNSSSSSTSSYESPTYSAMFQGAEGKHYESWCRANTTPEIMFIFKTMEEFNDSIGTKPICTIHVHCHFCPVGLITSPLEMCPICMESSEKHLLETTLCGHHFHLKCLDSYVKKKITHWDEDEEILCIPCPMCRMDLHWCTDCNKVGFDCMCGED